MFVCLCVQSAAVTQLVPRKFQAIHWVAVVRTQTVSCVNVRSVWLDASVTPVNLATGTYVFTTLTDVKVRTDVHCWSVTGFHASITTGVQQGIKLWCNLSVCLMPVEQKRCVLYISLLWNTNRNPHAWLHGHWKWPKRP